MDFTLSPEQELLRTTARDLCTRECPPSLVREHMEDPSVVRRTWPALKDWVQVGGGSMADLCLFLEETGAVLLPGPFLATTSLFVPLLGAVASGEHFSELLAKASSGEMTGTVALASTDARWEANDHQVKSFVPEAERVDSIAVVSAPSRNPLAPRVSVFRREDVSVRPIATIDPSRRLAEVDFSGATPVLEPIDTGAGALDDLLGRAYIAISAELMGTTRWLLDTTIAYACQRRQFGRPIGSFQAIKHKLADIALLREQAWSSVYYAAMCFDANDPARRRAAHVAKVIASHAAIRCAKEAIQIHGGIGYTWEHDLHLYLRRAFATEDFLGTTDWHLDRLADDVL